LKFPHQDLHQLARTGLGVVGNQTEMTGWAHARQVGLAATRGKRSSALRHVAVKLRARDWPVIEGRAKNWREIGRFLATDQTRMKHRFRDSVRGVLFRVKRVSRVARGPSSATLRQDDPLFRPIVHGGLFFTPSRSSLQGSPVGVGGVRGGEHRALAALQGYGCALNFVRKNSFAARLGATERRVSRSAPLGKVTRATTS
jgi:hypothetical protein